jgi:hypothetical protein
VDRKVLIGLALGATALAFIGKRRRSSLSGLGYPAVQHALHRVTSGGAAGAHYMAAKRFADDGDCPRAFEALFHAEYLSGKSSAHAASTADPGTAKALSKGHGPRVQIARAKEVRKYAKTIRTHVRNRCFTSARKLKVKDPRQDDLF